MSQIVIFKRSGKSRDIESHTAKQKAHGAAHIVLPLMTAHRICFPFRHFPARAMAARRAPGAAEAEKMRHRNNIDISVTYRFSNSRSVRIGDDASPMPSLTPYSSR
ncbi:hypothetical protein [Burkholderia sp. 3C]